MTRKSRRLILIAACGAVLALALGTAAGWFVVVHVFAIEWSPQWLSVAATLGTAALLTVTTGLIGSLPALRARPAEALRAL